MTSCGRIPYLFFAECVNALEFLKAKVVSLFYLFQRLVFPNVVSHSSSLSAHTFKIGGVENGGNTCILSILLQEFAALPDYYGPFLTALLKYQPNETPHHFQSRQELQLFLYQCVQKINSGSLVKAADSQKITQLLVQLGWQKEISSRWIQYLHRVAPSIFSLPQSSPHRLYDLLLDLFPEVVSANKIALLAKISDLSMRQIVETSPMKNDSTKKILWRITSDSSKPFSPEPAFQIGQRVFNLKLVHVSVNNLIGKHVMVYRKEGDQWACCNDSSVSCVREMPDRNVCISVYESQLINAEK